MGKGIPTGFARVWAWVQVQVAIFRPARNLYPWGQVRGLLFGVATFNMTDVFKKLLLDQL
jgi:hypothetical protein